MAKSSLRSWFGSVSAWVRATFGPAWRLTEAVVGWEGCGTAFLFPLGWLALEKGNFPLAKLLFTAASVFLAIRVVSGSQRLFHSGKSKTIASLLGILVVFGLWLGAWYWVLYKEVQSQELVPPSFIQWAWPGVIPWRWILLTAAITYVLARVAGRKRRAEISDSQIAKSAAFVCSDARKMELPVADDKEIAPICKQPEQEHQPMCLAAVAIFSREEGKEPIDIDCVATLRGSNGNLIKMEAVWWLNRPVRDEPTAKFHAGGKQWLIIAVGDYETGRVCTYEGHFDHFRIHDKEPGFPQFSKQFQDLTPEPPEKSVLYDVDVELITKRSDGSKVVHNTFPFELKVGERPKDMEFRMKEPRRLSPKS